MENIFESIEETEIPQTSHLIKKIAEKTECKGMRINFETNELIIACRYGHCLKKLDMESGNISVIAGLSGNRGDVVEKNPLDCRFYEINAICFDSKHNYIFCDRENGKIKKWIGALEQYLSLLKN